MLTSRISCPRKSQTEYQNLFVIAETHIDMNGCKKEMEKAQADLILLQKLACTGPDLTRTEVNGSFSNDLNGSWIRSTVVY